MQKSWFVVRYIVLALLCLSGCVGCGLEQPASLNSVARLQSTKFILQTYESESTEYLLDANGLQLMRLGGSPSASLDTVDWFLSTIPTADGEVCYYSRFLPPKHAASGQVLVFGIEDNVLVPKRSFTFPQKIGATYEVVWLSPRSFLVAPDRLGYFERGNSVDTIPIRVGMGVVPSTSDSATGDVVFYDTGLNGEVLNVVPCTSSSAFMVTRPTDTSIASVKLSANGVQDDASSERKLVVEKLPSVLSTGPLLASRASLKGLVSTVTGETWETLDRFTLWKPATWQEIGSVTLERPVRRGVAALSPTATVFAAQLESQQTIGVFDVATGKIVGSLSVDDRRDRKKGDTEAIVAALEFVDDDMLISIQLNGVIKQYDVRRRRETLRTQLTSPVSKSPR